MCARVYVFACHLGVRSLTVCHWFDITAEACGGSGSGLQGVSVLSVSPVRRGARAHPHLSASRLSTVMYAQRSVSLHHHPQSDSVYSSPLIYRFIFFLSLSVVNN